MIGAWMLAAALGVVDVCQWQGTEADTWETGPQPGTGVCVASCTEDCWTLDGGLLRLVAMVPAEDSADTVPVVYAMTDQADCEAVVIGHRGGKGQAFLTDSPVDPPGRQSPGWLDFEGQGGCFVELKWPLGWSTPSEGGQEVWAEGVCGRIASAYDYVVQEHAGCGRIGLVGTSGGAAAELCLLAAGGETAKRADWVYFSSMAPVDTLNSIVDELEARGFPRWTETYHTSNTGNATCNPESTLGDDEQGSLEKVEQVYDLAWPHKVRLDFPGAAHSADALCQDMSEAAKLQELTESLIASLEPTPTPTPTPTPVPTGVCCRPVEGSDACRDDATADQCECPETNSQGTYCFYWGPGELCTDYDPDATFDGSRWDMAPGTCPPVCDQGVCAP